MDDGPKFPITEQSLGLLKHLHTRGAGEEPVFVAEDPEVEGRGLSALHRRGLLSFSEEGLVSLTVDGMREIEGLIGLTE